MNTNNNNTMIGVFVPPGVQLRVGGPVKVSLAAAKKIKELMKRRSVCPEEEVNSIDTKIESIIQRSRVAIRSRTPGVIFEQHDLHGTGMRRHKVFVMPGNKSDYWVCVTNVPCPCCVGGKIRWHEAGYVPGYRICDKCHRTFLAKGNNQLPKLVLDI